jgi:hypothetical protein
MSEMEKRVSDREADALLSGQTPVGRPELGDLASMMSELRDASRSVPAPLSSAAFQARLDDHLVASLSMNDDAISASSPIAGATPTSVGQPSALTQGVRKMIAWLAGLGLASKIALGTGVMVVAASGVGAAGALPGPVQSAFDTIVSTVTGSDDELDDDPARVDDDESDVDDDPVRVDDDESDVDDDPVRVDDDESDVDDDGERTDDDESDVNDDPERTDDDESDVNDDPAPETDDESDADDDPAPDTDDESDVDDDPAPADED